MKTSPKGGFEQVFKAIEYIDQNSTVFKRYRPYLQIKLFLQRRQIEQMLSYII